MPEKKSEAVINIASLSLRFGGLEALHRGDLKVKRFCLGLISLGLKRGDKVSILGENKPEWFWTELAVQSAGGAAVGIFTDCLPGEVKYYVEHSDSTFVVAHDQEQVDKLLEIKDALPKLKKVIYWDQKGLWSYTDPILLPFDEVIGFGKDYEKKKVPRCFFPPGTLKHDVYLTRLAKSGANYIWAGDVDPTPTNIIRDAYSLGLTKNIQFLNGYWGPTALGIGVHAKALEGTVIVSFFQRGEEARNNPYVKRLWKKHRRPSEKFN